MFTPSNSGEIYMLHNERDEPVFLIRSNDGIFLDLEEGYSLTLYLEPNKNILVVSYFFG